MKRIISFVLVLVMAFSLVPVTAFAQENDTSAGSAAPQAEVQSSGVSYSGRIFDASIADATATVSYSAPVSANLVVAIYSTDGSKMLASGVTPVSAGEGTAQVEIAIPEMPYAFAAKAFLLDEATNDPLSEEWQKVYGDLTWNLDSQGVLTISGTGDMRNLYSEDSNYAPWYDRYEEISRVVIESGVTTIADGAFWDCWNLTDVSIPDTVISIGHDAFNHCLSLGSITLPDSITSIGVEAFWYCESLKSIVIPSNVTYIGVVAFGFCSSLTSVTIPEGVTVIAEAAFVGCGNLTDVYYSGTSLEWNEIAIGTENECLTNATIHCSDGDIAPAAITAEDELLDDLEEAPTEPVTEPTTEPDPEPTTEPATEPTTEPATEPATEPITAPETEPVTETEPAPETEPAAETEEPLTADSLSNIQWYRLPEGAKVTSQPVLQTVAAISGTESNRGNMRSVKFTGLEPGAEYVLIVSTVPGSLVPYILQYIDQSNAAADGTLSFTYIPREDVSAVVQLYGVPGQRSITLDREYLTMKVGDDPETLAAQVVPGDWAGELTWAAENPEEGEAVIFVENGIVTPLSVGTAYAVATVTHDGYTFSARCRVDVTEEPANEEMVLGVQLGTDAVTAELFSTQYASFDTVLLLNQNLPSMAMFSMRRSAPQNNGVAIESARFEDSAAAACFDLVVKDDRTVLVVPTQNAIDNYTSVKSSYTSRVIVTVCGEDFTTDTALKLSVKKTVPKLKAENLTFNPFYTEQAQAIKITGATVTNITVDESKATAKAPAIPTWLELIGDVLLSDNAPKSGSGKVNLLVETEEWAIPVAVTVSVKLAYKAPSLKLDASSVTLPVYTQPDDSGEYSDRITLRLQCKNKGDTLKSLGVSGIEVPDGWYVWCYEDTIATGNGEFYMQPAFKLTSTQKITLKVHFYETDNVVELPLTVKPQQIPLKLTLYADYKGLKLNSMVGDGFFVPWGTSPQYVDYSQCGLVWDIYNKQGNVATDMFTTEILSDGRLAVWTTEGTQPGNYELRLDLQNWQTGEIRTDESTVIKFTVLSQSTKPGLTMKAMTPIDLAFPDPGTVLNLSFQNYFLSDQNIQYFSVANAKNQYVTDAFELYWDNAKWGWFLAPQEDIPDGTYPLTCRVVIQGFYPLDVSTKVTVKRTPIKLKLSKTNLTLNSSIQDQATIDVTCLTKGYTMEAPVIRATVNGLDLSYVDGKLTVATNSRTRPGTTYTIPISATAKDPIVTLTVKTPAWDKSAVSATLKATGAIDPIRDSSTVVITPTYKNYTGEAELEKAITIWASRDGKIYNQNVTDWFQITENENGTFAITKVSGYELDTSLKYRVTLSFPGTSNSAPAYTALSVKAGRATVKAVGTPVLYKQDRNSHGTFQITVADKTLNPLERVEFKDPKQAALFDVFYYGNGTVAIGFKDGIVQNVKYPTSVSLNLFFTGNGSQKPDATVSVKLQIR